MVLSSGTLDLLSFYSFTFLLLNSLFTFLLFYLFTLKKQGFFALQTRLLYNANKASLESKEALFLI